MRRLAASALCLLTIAYLSSCSGPTPLDSPDAGRSAAYEPGVPSFDLEAIPTLRGERSGVDVYIGIPQASLIYTATDSGYVARYDLSLRVRDERGRDTQWFTSSRESLVAPTAEATRAHERIRRAERIQLPPGTFVIEGVLVDEESGEQAVRRQRVEVFDHDGTPRLSRPLVLAASGSEARSEPVVALHLPGRLDSLRSVVEAYEAPSGSMLTLHLLRLRVDSTVALPPFWLSPPRGSLAVRGVDETSGDTLWARSAVLEDRAEQTVAFDLPELSSGLYRLDFRLVAEDGTTLDRMRRALSIKGEAFPRLATLAELVDALDYIAYPREREFIAQGTTPRERRRRFDAFWGGLVSDRRVATNLLRQYYERIEEANVLFSSYKTGWKTDRGMLYVILGAPDYVEETFEGQVWHYGYDPQDPAGSYVFERVVAFDGADAFGHYVLVRQPIYERAWTQAIARWRRGVVR